MEIEREEVEKSYNRIPPTCSSDPWLVYIHDKRGLKHSFYKISQGKEIVRNIRSMRHKHILSSSYGWFLLHNIQSLTCSLLNPISNQKIELPFLHIFKYQVSLLSSPPTNPNCTVLFITNDKVNSRNMVTFKFCRPNIDGANDVWIEKKLYMNGLYVEDAISFDGNIYAVDKMDGGVFVIEVVETSTITFRRIVMDAVRPLPYPLEYDSVRKYLVESCGFLYAVRLIMWDNLEPLAIQELEVFKMIEKVDDDNLDVMAWDKVNSIGDDRVFFFSSNSSTSCSATEAGIEGNSIYFTLKKDLSLYAFSLKKHGGFQVSHPCPTVKFKWSEVTWLSPSP